MKLGLALSGGGTRGIAHVGVLKALEDNNIKIDIIGGTSSGALVSSLYAIGFSPYYIYEVFKMYSKEIVGLNSSYMFSGIKKYLKNKKVEVTGLKTGESLEKLYNKLAFRKGFNKIGELTKMPLVITAVDVKEAQEYIFTNKVPYFVHVNLKDTAFMMVEY